MNWRPLCCATATSPICFEKLKYAIFVKADPTFSDPIISQEYKARFLLYVGCYLGCTAISRKYLPSPLSMSFFANFLWTFSSWIMKRTFISSFMQCIMVIFARTCRENLLHRFICRPFLAHNYRYEKVMIF